jgi:Flp pilus assembly protein TadG
MKKKQERGVTFLLATVSLMFIIPMIGLAIDVGFLYAIKSKLQGAVDGAALASARALSLGETLSAQTTSAQNNAVNWFYANFPASYLNVATVTMTTTNVNVFTDPNNPQLRDVTVFASSVVNTMFMRWLGVNSVTVTAVGNASRRTVVAMLVLDRSGSMGASCASLIASAKLFVGQFAEGSDYIGALSFSDNYYLHSAPVQNFQQVLGYVNDSGSAVGSGAGALDNITCNGGTGTPGAISLAYNQLYKMALPGALNVLLIETDGLPNTMLMNFWDSTNSVAGIMNGSNCTDIQIKKKNAGGFASASAVNNLWTTMPANWLGLGTAGSFFPAITGLVTQPYGQDPSSGQYFLLTLDPYSAQEGGYTPPNFNVSQVVKAPGCYFYTDNQGQNPAYEQSPPDAWSDIAWFPATDVFGNALNPSTGAYKSGVTMTGTHVVANNWTVYKAGVYNAVDNMGYRARTNMGLSANSGIGPVTIFTIGLGGNPGDGPDPILLQRLANDPNGDNYNVPPLYSACSAEPTCAQYPGQPQGAFIYSANRNNLSEAFLAISSQVLRLSK